MRQFCDAVLRSSMLREAQQCCAKHGIACKCNFAARSAAIGGCAHHATLCCKAAHCAAKQHIVLRSCTLLCCEAERCCAAKQHFSVLRSSTLLCCEAALRCAAKQHAGEAPLAGGKCRNQGVKRQACYGSSCATMLHPPGRAVWHGPLDLVPRRVGLVKRSGARPLLWSYGSDPTRTLTFFLGRTFGRPLNPRACGDVPQFLYLHACCN